MCTKEEVYAIVYDLLDTKYAGSHRIAREEILDIMVADHVFIPARCIRRPVGVDADNARKFISQALGERGYSRISGRTSKNPIFVPGVVV